ncbi:MAG: hypothetical protein QOD86_2741 [Miltoncostaeaceae bacterium]|jgi:hypothetical protein|nr:hypothetical protein [Miltoncostaeaceae bacterium]
MERKIRRRRAAAADRSKGRLGRRLAAVLPIAAAIGAVIGLPFAIAMSDWRPIVALAALAAALAGTVAAAVDDGRVGRRIDWVGQDPGLDRARTAALREDEELVREEASRALARGISPEAVADALGHPAWPPDRVAALLREPEAAR